MSYGFLERISTPSVKAAQAANGSAEMWDRFKGDRAFDQFTESEAAFIAARDSFYMATVSEAGWPYVQHRGGPVGFLKVLDEITLGFADFRGNRQYVSLGEYRGKQSRRIDPDGLSAPNPPEDFGHMEPHDLEAGSDLASRLMVPGYRGKPERAFLLHLEAFDWNCQQHITPRFTVAEIENTILPLRSRIAALEAENAALRSNPRKHLEDPIS